MTEFKFTSYSNESGSSLSLSVCCLFINITVSTESCLYLSSCYPIEPDRFTGRSIVFSQLIIPDRCSSDKSSISGVGENIRLSSETGLTGTKLSFMKIRSRVLACLYRMPSTSIGFDCYYCLNCYASISVSDFWADRAGVS